MKRRLAAAVVAASALGAACLSIPPFTPTRLLMYTPDGSGGLVTTTSFASLQFSLHFGSGSGFHFPDELKIENSDNLLGHDDTVLCYDENVAGLSLYPTPRISTDITTPVTAPPIKNDLVAVWTGPAVVQVQLDWTTQFGCNHTRAPQGTSTFTVFPDGRIVRHDQLRDPMPLQISAGTCKCDNYVDSTTTPDYFIIESYWTFARGSQSPYSLSMDGASAMGPLPTMRNTDTVNTGAFCLDSGHYQLASLQAAPDGSAQVFGTERLIGHRHQLQFGGTLDTLPGDASSALFLSVEDSGCSRASKRMFKPPTVTIDGQTVSASPVNGLYGGDPGSGTGPGFAMSVDGHSTLQADAVPFAVWLRFQSAVDGVRATAKDVPMLKYTPQRIDDQNWIVWFPDSLVAGKPIQLEPL